MHQEQRSSVRYEGQLSSSVSRDKACISTSVQQVDKQGKQEIISKKKYSFVRFELIHRELTYGSGSVEFNSLNNMIREDINSGIKKSINNK